MLFARCFKYHLGCLPITIRMFLCLKRVTNMFRYFQRAYTPRLRACQPRRGSRYCLFRRLGLIIALMIALPLTALSAGSGPATSVIDLTSTPYQAGFLSPYNDTYRQRDPYQVAGANGVLFFTDGIRSTATSCGKAMAAPLVRCF